MYKIKEGLEQEYQEYYELNKKRNDGSDLDGYGQAIMDYARRWAEIMEAEFEKGHALKDFASVTSHKADIEGITGFMYGCAVSELVKFWEYGDSLRIWHNGNYGVHPSEQGVVNPAILTIAVDDDE